MNLEVFPTILQIVRIFSIGKKMGDHPTLTSKGQITIPKDVRDRLSLKTGDAVAWTVFGSYLIGTPRNLDFAGLAGLLGDPPGGPASFDEIDASVMEAVGRHVGGDDTMDDREAAE